MPFAIRTSSIMDGQPCSYCRLIDVGSVNHGIGSSVAHEIEAGASKPPEKEMRPLMAGIEPPKAGTRMSMLPVACRTANVESGSTTIPRDNWDTSAAAAQGR